ncbi:MAG TPA: c-type cytochrome domain-containing protein [Bdellovibrionales bacterium]|nr:c-type cytochrome domain-containing protein [Bdellovibrionales bacterium]
MKSVLAFLILLASGCAQVGDLEFKEPAPPVKPLVLTSSYESIRQNILLPKCIECHNRGAESPHGIDLTTYENVLDQTNFPPLVTPGVPEESSLYVSVAPGGSMPKKGPRLTDSELQAVYDWIKNGAKKD